MFFLFEFIDISYINKNALLLMSIKISSLKLSLNIVVTHSCYNSLYVILKVSPKRIDPFSISINTVVQLEC